MKPLLATDYEPGKLRFPVYVQPKIDGVRGLNLFGTLTGRSLKKPENAFTVRRFSHSAFLGFDGELALNVGETHPDLCRMTTSAVSTIKGEPDVVWHVFDYVGEGYAQKPFHERLVRLKQVVASLPEHLARNIRVVPTYIVAGQEELDKADEWYISQGYEGTIIRDPNGLYKYGRSTVREQILLRIKQFVEEDAIVVDVHEGCRNENEATTNELGLTERSSHQANMIPNGMVGRLICRVRKDIVFQNDILFRADQMITVGPGRLPHEDRKRFFEDQSLIIGKMIKFKFFPKGVKDKPRFPTFQSFRGDTDR